MMMALGIWCVCLGKGGSIIYGLKIQTVELANVDSSTGSALYHLHDLGQVT